MKKFLSFALKVAISAVLLAILLRSVDPARLRHDLGRLELGRLTLLLFVCWAGQLLCAQRWRLLAASLGMAMSYRTAVELYFVGMLFNIGLPSLVGGDVVKALMLSRKTAAPVRRSIASVLQDRAVGLIALLVYGSFAALAAPLRWRGVPLVLFYTAAWLGIAAVFAVIWQGRRWYRPSSAPGNRFSRLLTEAEEFHRALVTMRLPGAGGAAQVIGFSLLNSALVLWVFQQVSTAAGHTIGLAPFSALFPLITLVSMLPISLGGVGIREWAYVEALGAMGVAPEAALTISLASSALIIVLDLAGLFFLPALPAELRSNPTHE